jgi:ADP-ribose pyrophosphatase
MKKKQIYVGKVLKLSIEKRRLPNGVTIDLELIRHPGAVVIVPMVTAQKIILIRQYRAAIDSYIWELPAGTIDAHESALICARRELIEEIGYKADLFEGLGFIYPAPGYTTEKIFIFRAEGLVKVQRDHQKDEVISPRVFTREQVAGLLRNKKILDAKTICALVAAGVV